MTSKEENIHGTHLLSSYNQSESSFAGLVEQFHKNGSISLQSAGGISMSTLNGDFCYENSSHASKKKYCRARVTCALLLYLHLRVKFQSMQRKKDFPLIT